MVIYSKIDISGTTVNDVLNSQVSKSIGANNVASRFSTTLDNFGGKNSNKYTIGNEVEIYADVDTNPPTTKIFTGIVENIIYPSQGLTEFLELSGRDYTARLIDRTVEPEVYNNLPAGSIVKDIINKYTDDITVTNVHDSPTIISRITFNHTPVFDAVKKLAELADYTFYIDNDKDLHFQEPKTESSGETFDSTNVLDAKITERRDTVFNEVWVYGDRYLDSFKEEFTSDGTGSVFTLLYKPHSTQVDTGSPITALTRQVGAIAEMSTIPASGVDYLVNYDDKNIIFVSGTSLGYDSVPASGTLITVNYDRSLPIVKVGKDNNSIAQYGKRVKKIIDKSIKDPNAAQELMVAELTKTINPQKEGNIKVKGVTNIVPSQTCIVNLPHQNINNKVYEIVEAQYDFNKNRNFQDDVLQVRVNKKLSDVTDTIKDLINQVRVIQAQDIDNSDVLTRFEYTAGSLSIRPSGCEVYSRSIAGDTMIWGNPSFGIWGTSKWGTTANVSFILGNSQGAILGTSKLGTQVSDWQLVWSGCYV